MMMMVVMVRVCRRPPKLGRSSLLAQHMHRSSTTVSNNPQHDLADNRHRQNDTVDEPQGSDAEQQLFSPPKTVQLTGSGDAAAVSRSVASPCSIESAIDSVISQARAEVEMVPDLPDTLPPDLVEVVNALKDVVC